MSKRVLSIVFSYILALFFAVTMLAGVLCDFAYKTVCDPELLVSHAISSGYATELYDEILYKWENLLSITGIDDTEPFTQVLTLERVEDAAYSYLRNAYTGISRRSVMDCAKSWISSEISPSRCRRGGIRRHRVPILKNKSLRKAFFSANSRIS